MSLYFDTPVQFKEVGAITTNGAWHPSSPLLAVASYSQERGGFVSIFDELGEPLRDVEPPWHPVAQVTVLAWRPERPLLAAGWEDGALRIWDGSAPGFTTVPAPHTAPLMLLAFSEKGGRLVSADSTGSLVGWKVDTRNQLFTAFHHDLKESITHLTFRLSVQSKAQQEIEHLARAAVNGDEQALDMFSNWRPRTAANKINVHANTNDNHCFYIGTQSGIVYYVNQTGSCTEVLNTEGQPLISIMYHPTKDSIIIMMEGLNIGHFAVDANGNLTELVKVKLSGKSQAFRGANSQGLVWAGPGLLAILTGDMIVRIWDIDNSDNYVLPTAESRRTAEDRENMESAIFTCISYCKLNNILCAGTNLGQIYFWSHATLNSEKYMENPESAWALKTVNQISGTVKQLFWGSVNMIVPLLAVNCITKVYILKEQTLNTCYSEHIWATQTNATEVILNSDKGSTILKSDVQISCIAISNDYIVASNGKLIMVYEIMWAEQLQENQQINPNFRPDRALSTRLVHSFLCENENIFVFDKRIIALTALGIQIRYLNGIPATSISTASIEGEPIGMDINNAFLTIFTMNGFIKLFDLSKADAKFMITSKNIYDLCVDFGEIIWAKCNAGGNRVAFTIASANLIPDQKLYVWDVDNDALVVFYDFIELNPTATVPAVDPTADDIDANVLLNDSQKQNSKICGNRIPVSFFWDYQDDRLLICSAKKLKSSMDTDSYIGKPGSLFFSEVEPEHKNEEKLVNADHIVISMFITTDHKIVVKEIQEFSGEAHLIGLYCPFFITLENGCVKRNLISDFNGMDSYDNSTKKALLDFSYNLSLGNMDAAIQSIRLLPNGSNAWRNLARVCVKTRRVDVARVCLGHVGAAREARALRLAMEDATLEPEAVVAVLAVQLGMLDEAEQLYKQCKRYDLLNKLYQARNKFPQATTIAAKSDRIHMRSTAFAWAKALESSGDIQLAIQRYEEAACHRDNVPRLLLDRPRELEEYIKKGNDKDLLKWWGQYLESTGDMANALESYEAAGDCFSQVRVLCFSQQEERAAQVARASGDKAASYHMARFYETNDDIENAIAFFVKAQAYTNAVRLCKEHNFVDELWNIATLANKRDKMECARYYEGLKDIDKAILLYHQSGMIHKALDLAFRTKKYDTLQMIATDLDTNSDPTLVQKCAKYFVENEHYEKAVDLLAVGKQYIEALEICLQHNVQVTELLAERLTPDKDELEDATRVSVLEKLAESLQMQGNYHLATKKFTQAGNKTRAMKSLLKSGDTEKIIFFANVSRQKEIYVMAANYLQSLDWQNQPNVLRNIINFYSKGRALDLLANFYVACAQVEIDEFQNYEKALGALTEASRALAKVATPVDAARHRRATDIVNAQMAAIKRFVDVRRLFERGDVPAGLAQSRQLINSADANVEKYIRRGDIYAIMIQHAVNVGDVAEAKQLLVELKQYLTNSGNVSLSYYLSSDVIQMLAKTLGMPISALLPAKSGSADAEPTSEEIEEQEIQEEVEDES